MLEAADVLGQPVHQHLRYASAFCKRAGLVNHISKMFGPYGQIFIPLEFFDTVCRRLETGIGSAGYKQRDGDSMRSQFCVKAFRKGVDTGLGGGVH